MTKAVVAFILALTVSNAAYGQAAPPPAPTTGPTYCNVYSGNADEHLKQIKQTCTAGDIVILPRRYIWIAAVMCDFSRSIASTAEDVVCVLGKERPLKKPR